MSNVLSLYLLSCSAFQQLINGERLICMFGMKLFVPCMYRCKKGGQRKENNIFFFFILKASIFIEYRLTNVVEQESHLTEQHL